MTQIMTVVNKNAIDEMALRFGWRKPKGCAIPKQPAASYVYGRVVGRAWTETRNGRVPTSRFLGTWETCAGNANTRDNAMVALCGGCHPQWEVLMLGKSEPAKWEVVCRTEGERGVSWIDYTVMVEWCFDTNRGSWEVKANCLHGTRTTPAKGYKEEVIPGCSATDTVGLLRDLGVSRWSVRNPEKVEEVYSHLVDVLGEP